MGLKKKKRKTGKLLICILAVVIMLVPAVSAFASETGDAVEIVEEAEEGDDFPAEKNAVSDPGMAMEEPELFIEASHSAMPLLDASSATGTFWSDPAWGDGDILFYGSVYGMTLPAYCIDHGLTRPRGTYTEISGYTSSVLGYIMRYGYPNTNWGLSDAEAQYLTQIAVFGAMGVDLYNISDGMMPPVYIYNVCWGNGNFNISLNLLAQAQANATSADQAYASFWTPDNGVSQRVVVPVPTASLTVTKTTSATGICRDQLIGNSMYSQDFSGAEFSVRIYDTNAGSWGAETVYTTGTDGTFTVTGLVASNQVEVTETKAPKGYVIPDDAVQTVILSKGSNSCIFKDAPTFDPASIFMFKVKYVNGVMVKEPVQGAVFRMDYYDSIELRDVPLRTWYFITDAKGSFKYTPTWLASGYESDQLYVDNFGLYDVPLGSVTMTEVEAPAGYALFEGQLSGTITQNPDTGLAEFKWTNTASGHISVENGIIYLAEEEIVIAVDKTDGGTGRRLCGATLQLIEGETVLREWTTDGTVCEIKNIIMAGHTYKIREKSAPSGYKLAEDIVFTVDAEGNITITSEGIGTYTNGNGYLTLVMEDTKMIVLPLTGSSDGLWLIITGLVIFVSGLTCFLIIHNNASGNGGPGEGSAIKSHKNKKILGVVIGVATSLIVTIPAFAAGTVEVVRNGDQEISYRCYLLVSGTYEEEALWNVELAEDIGMAAWKEAGVPEENLGNAKVTVKWLAEKVRDDRDGMFVKKLAEAITKADSIKPDYTFKSGDKTEVEDGYYLVVSGDTYPMLFLVGGGEIQAIYEKLIPRDNPETGDGENFRIYLWICIAGFLVTGGFLLFLLRQESREVKESNKTETITDYVTGKKEKDERE